MDLFNDIENDRVLKKTFKHFKKKWPYLSELSLKRIKDTKFHLNILSSKREVESYRKISLNRLIYDFKVEIPERLLKQIRIEWIESKQVGHALYHSLVIYCKDQDRLKEIVTKNPFDDQAVRYIRDIEFLKKIANRKATREENVTNDEYEIIDTKIVDNYHQRERAIEKINDIEFLKNHLLNEDSRLAEHKIRILNLIKEGKSISEIAVLQNRSVSELEHLLGERD